MRGSRAPDSKRLIDDDDRDDTSAEVLGAVARLDGEDYSDDGPAYSVEDAVQHMGWGKFQTRLLFQCGACWSADAMEMMLLGFTLPVLEKEWGLSPGEVGLIGAMTFVGMLCGASFWGKMADKFGRRTGYMGSVVFVGVFGLLSTFVPGNKSVGFPIFVLCRLFVGFGTGGAPVSFGLFAELVPSSLRGLSLVAVEGGFWVCGSITSAATAWAVMPVLGWRPFLAFSALPAWCLLLLWRFLPESPRYLMISNRRDKAIQVLEKMSRLNEVPLPDGHLESCASASMNRKLGSYSELFGIERLQDLKFRITDAKMLRKTVLLMFIWAACTMCYYGMVFITPRFFKLSSCEEGDDSSSCQAQTYRQAFMTTLAEIPGLVFAAVCVDRVGRTNTLTILFSTAATATLMLLLSDSSQPGCPSTLGAVSDTIAVVFMFFARGSVQGSFTTTYVMTPEMYPTTIRTTGLGTCSAVARVAGILTSFVAEGQCVPTALIMFGATAAFAAICVRGLPETAGKALQEVMEVDDSDDEHTSLTDVVEDKPHGSAVAPTANNQDVDKIPLRLSAA